MSTRLQALAPDRDLEIHRLAEEYLLIDGALPYVAGLRPDLGKVDILRPHRERDLVACDEAIAARAHLAEVATDAVEPRRAVGAAHRRGHEVGAADEVGDEGRGRPLVHLARRADLLDAPAVHHRDGVRER